MLAASLPVVLFFLCFPSDSKSINVDGCNIISNNPNTVGAPYFEDRPHFPVYSCLSSRNNNNYDVHIIGVYSSGSDHSFLYPTTTSHVCFNQSELSSDKPLILVFTNYVSTRWILHIPEGAVISKVVLCSYQNSTVIFPRAQVLQGERGPRLFGFGSDIGGGSTDRLLQYLSSTYGPVSSFTGTYEANKWILSIPGIPTNISTRLGPQTCDTTVNVDGCNIISDSSTAVGKPSARFGRNNPIYSCLSTKNNSNYSIHVISIREASWFHSIASPLSHNSNVILNGTMSFSDKPLVLVFSTFAPTQWILHIPEGVIVNKVILCSYYNSSVIFIGGQVLQVEIGPRIYGYGADTGRTERFLQYISSTLGPVTSFTGTYEANQWTLHISKIPAPISAHQGSIQTSVSTTEVYDTVEDYLITTTEDLQIAPLGEMTSTIQKDYSTTGTESLQIAQKQQTILIISMAVIIALLSVFGCSITIIFIVIFYRKTGTKGNVRETVQDPLYEEIKVTEDDFQVKDNQCYGSHPTEIVPPKNVAYEIVSSIF